MSNNKTLKPKGRSKKYIKNLDLVKQELSKKPLFSVEEAVDLLLKFEKSNFKNGDTVELHFKLNINPTKSDQLVRSSVVLPNGTGKEVKVVAFVKPENQELAKKAGAYKAGGEDLIAEIKTSGKIDFDKAIAEPAMMPKLPSIARILGVAGVMPNPKNGTVGTEIEMMIKQIMGGKVDFKNDKTANLHVPCGKLNKNFPKEKLIENIKAVIEAVLNSKPEVIKRKFVLTSHLTATTTPSVPLSIN